MRSLFLVCSVLFLGWVSSALAASSESIAVVVNADAITQSDVNDRLKLVLVSSGLPDSAEIRAKVTPQVISSLIEEQIMLQEAERLGIKVEKEEIDGGFATIAKQNNFDPETFQKALRGSGINILTMGRQIKSQLSWNKVIQEKIRPQVSVGEADIDAYLEHLQNNKGKAEYLVAEIFLPIDNPQQEGNTQQLANRLVSETRSGKIPFFKMAQQFSKAPGAAQGGDMGWVQQGQLSEELDAALAALQPNEVSVPVRSLSGYHILLLRERRTITDETMPSREEVMGKIGTERLDRAQRRYLMDLRSSAFIDNRAGS